MRVLKGRDWELFEELIGLTQPTLQKIMDKYLRKHYKKVVSTVDYIYAEGDIPIALVAHMDTVLPKPPEDVYYDRIKNVIFGSDGLGADDRAGIWLIIQIIRSGLRPHIILTTDEETGCIGATMLAHDYPESPFKDLRYLIQLDRQGQCDCVFYECDNEEFEKYIEDFGFITALGSFSDISVICPEWEIAGVNLSVGYKHEHTKSEVLFVQPMLSTLDKVKKMLKAENIPSFKYIPSPYAGYGSWFGCSSATNFQVKCAGCGKITVDFNAQPTKKLGGGTVFYCFDCLPNTDLIDWCINCGEAYEVDPKVDTLYCEDCRKAVKDEK